MRASRLFCAATLTIVATTFSAPSVHAQAAKGAVKAPAPTAPMVTPPPAQGLIDQAVVAAKADHKAVLAEFGASWCGWCHRFEAFIASPVAGKIMRDNFEIVHLVVDESPDKKALENPGGSDIRDAMGGKGEGIPFFFFLDDNGQKIGDANIVPPNNALVGHPDLPQEILAFDGLLRKVAPKMTEDQRTTIHDYLTKVADDAHVAEAAALAKAKAAAALKADSIAKAKAAGGGGGSH